MRNALALLALAVSPLAAQEAARKPELFPPVMQLLGQDRPAAALAPADFDTQVTRLNAADAATRRAAAVALGNDRSSQSVASLSRAAQGDSEWQVRMQAVRSLGQLGSRDAALALEVPLRDADPAVRAAAAMALGDIGGVDAVRLLANALRAEHEEFARQMISDAIKKVLAR